jgi:hypothetical protein
VQINNNWQNFRLLFKSVKAAFNLLFSFIVHNYVHAFVENSVELEVRGAYIEDDCTKIGPRILFSWWSDYGLPNMRVVLINNVHIN